MIHHKRRSSRAVDWIGFAIIWLVLAGGLVTGCILSMLNAPNINPALVVTAGIGGGLLGAMPGAILFALWIRWRD